MCAPSSFTNWSLDGSVKHTVRQMVSEPGHRFESLESHCEGGIVRDFTIRSNTNGLGLRSNAIKNVCPLILHQLVVGWIGKAHGLTTPIPTLFISLNIALSKLTFREFWGGGGDHYFMVVNEPPLMLKPHSLLVGIPAMLVVHSRQLVRWDSLYSSHASNFYETRLSTSTSSSSPSFYLPCEHIGWCLKWWRNSESHEIRTQATISILVKLLDIPKVHESHSLLLHYSAHMCL